jgi:hypothetical protein
VLLLAAPLLAANALALLDLDVLLRDVLVGAGIGNLTGKSVVLLREQTDGEHSSHWVRRVEFAWTGAFACVAMVLSLLLR